MVLTRARYATMATFVDGNVQPVLEPDLPCAHPLDEDQARAKLVLKVLNSIIPVREGIVAIDATKIEDRGEHYWRVIFHTSGNCITPVNNNDVAAPPVHTSCQDGRKVFHYLKCFVPRACFIRGASGGVRCLRQNFPCHKPVSEEDYNTADASLRLRLERMDNMPPLYFVREPSTPPKSTMHWVA